MELERAGVWRCTSRWRVRYKDMVPSMQKRPSSTTSSTAYFPPLFNRRIDKTFAVFLSHSTVFTLTIFRNGWRSSNRCSHARIGLPERKAAHLPSLPRHLPLLSLGLLVRPLRCPQQAFPDCPRYHQASIYRPSSCLLRWRLPALLAYCR